MLRVKICGIKHVEDALLAADQGADAIGFIFYAKSPRYVLPEQASQISKQLPLHISRVGVFVNPEESELSAIQSIVKLDAIQIHGLPVEKNIVSLNGSAFILAIGVSDSPLREKIKQFSQSFDALSCDTHHPNLYGGTGKPFIWKMVKNLNDKYRIILAGGLNPENVVRAVDVASPYAVDINSGIEAYPGKKDPAKLEQIFQKLRKYRIDWKPEREQLFPLA
jgi:phosphoribosylanthranilate isomerase